MEMMMLNKAELDKKFVYSCLASIINRLNAQCVGRFYSVSMREGPEHKIYRKLLVKREIATIARWDGGQVDLSSKYSTACKLGSIIQSACQDFANQNGVRLDGLAA